MRWPLFALTSLAFGVRFVNLLRSPEPPGWDGYAWVIQLERLVGEGHLHWPDSSWVTWALAAIHFAVPSAIVAMKLGACLLAAVVVPVAWRAGGWPLALWAAASPTLMHLAGDFPRNLGAVAPLLYVATWRHPLPAKRGEGRGEGPLIPLLIAALLAALAHRVGAALVACIALGAAGGALLSRTSSRAVLLGGLTVFVSFIGASAVLPGLLHPADLERVSSQLDLSLHPLVPFSWLKLRHAHPVQVFELALAWPALAVGFVRFVREPPTRARTGALLFPLVVCVLPLWRTETLDLGYRLSLMAPAFAAPLLLPSAAAPSTRAGLLLPLVLLAPLGFEPLETPPYGAWRALIAKIPRPLPELLIAPTGLNFFYDFETGHEAMAWAPEPALDRANVFRLVFDVRDGEWSALSDDAEAVRLDAQVLYVREDAWERFVERVRKDDDEDLRRRVLAGKNPMKVRPASLMRAR